MLGAFAVTPPALLRRLDLTNTKWAGFMHIIQLYGKMDIILCVVYVSSLRLRSVSGRLFLLL